MDHITIHQPSNSWITCDSRRKELCQLQQRKLKWKVHWVSLMQDLGMSDVEIGYIQMSMVFPDGGDCCWYLEWKIKGEPEQSNIVWWTDVHDGVNLRQLKVQGGPVKRRKRVQRAVMVMKDGACVDDRNKTTLDELQHVPTLDSRKHDKRIVIEWLLGKYHCTHNRSNHLNLFIFKMTSEWCFGDSGVQGIRAFKTLPSPFDWTVENRSKELTWRNSAVMVAQIKIPVANCYGHSDINNFYFLFFYFFWFYFSFSLFYFLGKTMKKARDKEVTWNVTWYDVTSLEQDGRV